MKKILSVLFMTAFSILFFGRIVFPQELNKTNITKNNLSGIFSFDANSVAPDFIKNQNIAELNIENPKLKSEILAGVLSAVLPGAGEIYDGSYLKGAIFLAVEAAAITTALVYNHKGDTQTNFFQNYANEHWSVSRYAHWTAQNLSTLAPGISQSDIQKFQNAFPSDNSPVNWTLLNQMESEIGSDPNAGGYTHQLPNGGQQYYELIGKYDQYSKGWDQSNPNTWYTDLPSQLFWYAHQRGLANEYYSTGSTAVVFIYINHILSVIDAIWSVHRHNNEIAMNFRFDQHVLVNKIEYVPTLHLAINF